MNIKGFSKLTLLDYPGKLAGEIFTGGCNLRCPFCHNSRLVIGDEDNIPESEILSYLEKRKSILEGLVITGGEPLLGNDLDVFIEKVIALGYKVKLDTNGTFPDKLENLIKRGLLDYVAMDIKNSPEKYAETVGKPDFDMAPIYRSTELLMNSGIDYEFRTTFLKPFHTADDFYKIGEWLKGAKKYCIQSYSDSGEILAQYTEKNEASFAEMKALSKEELDIIYSISATFFQKTYKRY